MKGKTGTRKGLTAIVKHLVRAAEKTSLLGKAKKKISVDQVTRPSLNVYPLP